jgi:hypothetical protein
MNQAPVKQTAHIGFRLREWSSARRLLNREERVRREANRLRRSHAARRVQANRNEQERRYPHVSPYARFGLATPERVRPPVVRRTTERCLEWLRPECQALGWKLVQRLSL